MASLQLSMMTDDPWSINQKLFDQLCEYIQPGSSLLASAVASRLDSLFPSHRSPEDQLDTSSLESERTFFWNIWEPFHLVARQLPHDSPAQEKLISCLKTVSNTTSKTPVVKLGSEHGGPVESCRLWQDMFHFSGTFWEMAHFMEGDRSIEDQWRNMMAYGARLTREGLADLSWFGKRSLDAALEYDVVQADRRGRRERDVLAMDFSPGAELDYRVAVASDWIAYAGAKLFEKYNENKLEDATSVYGWQFWKQRFGDIVADERIAVQTQRLASAAKVRMELLEVERDSTS